MLLMTLLLVATFGVYNALGYAQVVYLPVVVHNITNHTGPSAPAYPNYPNNNYYNPPPYRPPQPQPQLQPLPVRPPAPVINAYPGPAPFVQPQSPPYVNNNSQCLPSKPGVLNAGSKEFGCPKPGDELVYKFTVNKSGRVYTRDKIIHFPGDLPPGHVSKGVITGIRCYQLNPKSSGTVTIKSGGIGHLSVELYLKASGVFDGLHYEVEIYTRKQ